ncbi:MAG: histidine kinase [Christiangramia sp.]|uniref:histidine kinase n=1 Tax=Christiangramia sp. TaxID=1931228 RepID=UPI003242973E
MSITRNAAQLYRITYEAYSKFANDINRCANLSEVGDVCQRHLKYLLNFRLIRMTIEQDDKYLVFELFNNNLDYGIRNGSEVLPYEKELCAKGIPIYTEDIPEKLVRKRIDLNVLSQPVLWGWSFDKYERKVLVSILSDQEMNFSAGDIEILKLVVDCIQAKFNEIYLKRQIAIRNQNLQEAYETIKSKNAEIEHIVENQQRIIEERTSEIAQKNEKLLHVSVLNAHNVREPLSRIQGIIQLFEYFDDDACRTELVPKLEQSVTEMDNVLKEVVEMASNELIELKASRI